jgi:hypothetical protein
MPKIIFVIIIIFSSCIKEIERDFTKQEIYPVVYAILSPTYPKITVNLSTTAQLNNSDITFINDATIIAYEGDSLLGELKSVFLGNYELEYTVKKGKRYRFEIYTTKYPLITCTDSVPLQLNINEINYRFDAGLDFYDTELSGLDVTVENNLNQNLFYHLLLKTKGEDFTGEDYFSLLDFNRFDDPVLMNEGLRTPLFSNKLMKENEYTIPLKFYRYSDIELILQLRSVSSSYYNFFKFMELHNNALDYAIFNFQPVNMYQNIKGAKGFIGSFVESDTIKIIAPNRYY